MKAALLLLILLVGCTPTTTCPTVNCPTCNTEPVEVNYNPEMIDSEGVEGLYFNVNGTSFDIINCGTKAYGAVAVDEIASMVSDGKIINNLLIQDFNYIGGCPDILRSFPDIKEIFVYGSVDTDEYIDLIYWSPLEKLNIIQ